MIRSKRLSRQLSRSAVVQAVASGGPISRASLARQVHLSRQTVSEIIFDLEAEGWIREIGRTEGHVGRSATTYDLVPDAAFVCGVDLGGTKVRAAIIDLACNIVSELTEPTDSRGGMHVAQQIGRLCRKTSEAANLNWSKVSFTTIGVPGAPIRKDGSVHTAPNISGIDTMDFAGALEAELGFGVRIENDVNLAAIGEQWSGCASEVDNMAFVSLGTGIGAGIVAGGQIVRGAMEGAGQLAFLPFGADPFDPVSLRKGALERQAGSFGMVRRYAELSGRQVEVREIFDLAQAADKHAECVLEETARLIARLIATIGGVVDPSVVVLGGSIGRRTELLARIKVALAACSPNSVDVRISELGDHVTLIGAAAVGLSHLHDSVFAAGLNGIESQ